MMDIRELEGRLDNAMESYKMQMQNRIEELQTLSDEEKLYSLQQTLDAMSKHAYYTFDEFKGGIIEYLKNNE